MKLLAHISELIAGRQTRRHRTGAAVRRLTAAPRAQHLRRVRVLAMQQAIDCRWQIGVATGIEMARRDLTARQASSFLTDVAARSDQTLTVVAKVVVAEGFANRD